MAKLVDALCSGRSAFTGVLVRIQFWAQRARVSAGLSVKEQNILSLKLKLTLFFVGLSTNASLWPFLHTQTHTHAVF